MMMQGSPLHMQFKISIDGPYFEESFISIIENVIPETPKSQREYLAKKLTMFLKENFSVSQEQ